MLGQGGDTRTWKYYYQAHPLYNCHKKFLFQEDTKMYASYRHTTHKQRIVQTRNTLIGKKVRKVLKGLTTDLCSCQ